MQNKFVDLHTHSNFSDGTYSPRELVSKAREEGLSAVALTDHDTTEGIEAAIKAGKEIGVEVIPGVELSCECYGEEVHVVGLFVDWKDSKFQDTLRALVEKRKARKNAIISKLKELGIDISPEKLNEFARGEVVGRLHIARVLESMGAVRNTNEAFRKYLGNNAPAYVSHARKTGEEVIKIIESVRGIPIIAHPQYLKKPELIIPDLAAKGIQGLEVYFPENGTTPSPAFLTYVKRWGLLQSAGSDCHGDAKDRHLLGKVKAPYALVVEMKEWLKKKYGY